MTGSKWPCWSRGDGPNDIHVPSNLNHSVILWFELLARGFSRAFHNSKGFSVWCVQILHITNMASSWGCWCSASFAVDCSSDRKLSCHGLSCSDLPVWVWITVKVIFGLADLSETVLRRVEPQGLWDSAKFNHNILWKIQLWPTDLLFLNVKINLSLFLTLKAAE